MKRKRYGGNFGYFINVEVGINAPREIIIRSIYLRMA
jgi:hypothetical protein